MESLANFLLCSGSLCRICNSLVVDNVLQININAISGGHQMAEIDNLEEGLQLRSSLNLRESHPLGDSLGEFVDASDDGMAVGACSVGLLVKSLDNECLLTSMAALQDDNHLAGFQTI